MRFEDSATHHDKMNDLNGKIIRTFAIPCAVIVIIMMFAIVPASLGIIADGAFALGEWSRAASKNPAVPYAQLIVSIGWKAVVGLFVACVLVGMVFQIYVIWAWPKK